MPNEPSVHDESVRVLLVDDEGRDRSRLRTRLAERPEIDLVAECTGGFGSVQVIRKVRPDLVFLSLRHPDAPELETVREVMRALDPAEHPLVVFVTDHPRFATEAFEVDAVDCLVRPFDSERLDRAVDRALERLRESERAELVDQVRDALAELGLDDVNVDGHANRLSLRTSEGVEVVPVESIDWIESDDVYARIHTTERSLLVRAALRDLERRLDPRTFVRIHRSTIVNVDRVRKVVRDERGAEHVVLRGGEVLRVSRGRRRSLYEVLEIVG